MLQSAIEARDWSDALTLAIECWRDTRDPAVARLVDRIAVRCEPVPPPQDHEQWIAGAAAYEPRRIATLIDYLPMRLMASEAKWDSIAERWPDTAIAAMTSRADRFDSSSNALDRLGAMERWPDEPRLAPAIATLLCSPAPLVAARLHESFRQLLVGMLVRLRDVRVLPRLRAHVQQGHASLAGVIAQLEMPVRSAGVEALLAQLEAPTPLEAMWARAAAEREARGVLADALVEIGDRRGAFITRQLAGDRATRLLRLEYERWLGFDLGAIAVRGGSEFRDGMLEVLCVGHTFTPRFAWSAAIGHRELRTVHTLRTATIMDAEGFGRFVDALPGLQRIEILELRPHMIGLQSIVDAVTRDVDIHISASIPDAEQIAAGCARAKLV